MANPTSAAALQEVAAAHQTFAETLRKPLLQAESALSQVEANLASQDGQAVAKPAVLPTKAVSYGSPVNNEAQRSSLPPSYSSPVNNEARHSSPPASYRSLANNSASAASDLIISEASKSPPKSPKSQSGPITGRRLSQACHARGSKFDNFTRYN